MRSSTDPNHKIDWDTFNGVDRTSKQYEYLEKVILIFKHYLYYIIMKKKFVRVVPIAPKVYLLLAVLSIN